MTSSSPRPSHTLNRDSSSMRKMTTNRHPGEALGQTVSPNRLKELIGYAKRRLRQEMAQSSAIRDMPVTEADRGIKAQAAKKETSR
jgi:hypothetical protein